MKNGFRQQYVFKNQINVYDNQTKFFELNIKN